MKKFIVTLIAMALVFALLPAAGGAVLLLPNSVEWDGQGSDSLRCDKLGESPERTADGWIHWIITQASDVTEAELVLGGSGEGTYAPTKYGPVVEFFTPYYDVETLTATLNYAGTLDTNSQFVISDYCPGNGGIQELIDISKTAETSYTRQHFWDIDKSIDTEDDWMHDGYNKIWLYIDGSGDETATWTVDVTYEGYEDSDWAVSGEITITNSATVPIVVTSIVDTLAGTVINVDCDLPATVPAGGQLICTYSEEGYVVGSNVVDVTYHVDEDNPVIETATADIVWGDPTSVVNDVVNIQDISDLFGTVDLGTVTAPNDAQFTYTKDFAWADYGADGCGDFSYDNTATIVETEQSASATLLVNVQCYDYETAYAKGDDAICFIPTFANWGWTNPIMPDTYEMELWAAAGQCDTTKGTLVGTVTVVYDDDGDVTVTYNVVAPYILDETHVYADYGMFPVNKKGQLTVAPGAYYNASPFDGSEVYVIAHAVVGIPDPDFGPQV